MEATNAEESAADNLDPRRQLLKKSTEMWNVIEQRSKGEDAAATKRAADELKTAQIQEGIVSTLSAMTGVLAAIAERLMPRKSRLLLSTSSYTYFCHVCVSVADQSLILALADRLVLALEPARQDFGAAGLKQFEIH